MQIEDGEGTGIKAGVDKENRLKVFGVSEPVDRHVNRTEGKCWSVSFEAVTAAGANDYFFYLKNTGNETYTITEIRISSSVATKIDFDHVSGTPTYVTGTDCAITNKNLGSSVSPDVSCKYDTDITGLTDEGLLFFQQCAVVDTIYNLSTSSNIILAPGQAIALKRVAATGAVTGVISMAALD